LIPFAPNNNKKLGEVKRFMPTYEYECKICGFSFEAFQGINDTPLSECPECGKEVRRLIVGGAGIIFKGSGFYINDSKKKPPSAEGTPPKPKVEKKEPAASKE
jgi:putative FmdB family regulatory protein